MSVNNKAKKRKFDTSSMQNDKEGPAVEVEQMKDTILQEELKAKKRKFMIWKNKLSPFNRTCTKFVPLSKLLTHLETSHYCCNTRTPLVVVDGSKTTRVITLLPENLYGEKYAREKLLKALSTFKVTTYWYLSSRTIQNCCKRKWEKITKTHQQKWTG